MELTNEEIIKDFLDRKEKNKVEITSLSYQLFERPGANGKTILVKYNDEGVICNTPCSYCYAETNLNPFRSGAYVMSVCTDCIINATLIEEYLQKIKEGDNGKVRKKRTTKQNPNTVNIDWSLFETTVKNKQAKLGNMAQKYKLYPDEMRKLIENKYGDKIIFKKGRTGGIYFNDKNTGIKS